MRILHIDTGAEMRGGQRQVLLLLKGLQTTGHDVMLLARERSPLWEEAVKIGFEVHPATTLQIWSESANFRIAHAHDARAHTFAAIACRCKFVVGRRVAFPVGRSLPSRWKYQRASRFLAVSKFVAGQLKAANILPEKIDVVYDGVEPVSPSEPWSADSPVVALASTDAQKGRDLVEQAAALAGIRVLFSDNLKRDLKRASLFVYISRAEGLGSAVLLALQMGVPVVASHVGGLAEIFQDHVSGIFTGNDPASIANAIREVLGNGALAHKLIRCGKARIAEEFTQGQLVRRTLLSYESALAG